MTLFGTHEDLGIPIEKCLEIYFSPSYSRFMEANCIRNHLTPDQLKEWAIEFNLKVMGDLRDRYILRNWVSHFSNWLSDPKRDKTKPPPHISLAATTKLQQNITANLSAKEKNRILHERNSNNQ